MIFIPTTPVSASYIATLEECETFFASHQGGTTILAADDADQILALQEATAILDSLPLRGERYELEYIYNNAQSDTNSDGITQTLEFPRYIDGVLCDYDHGTDLPIVPARVKAATCYLANQLLVDLEDTDSPISEKELQEAGVASFSLGKLSMSFKNGADTRYFGLPLKVFNLMKIYIQQNPIVL